MTIFLPRVESPDIHVEKPSFANGKYRWFDLPSCGGSFTAECFGLACLTDDHDCSLCDVANVKRDRVAFLVLLQFVARIRSFQHDDDFYPLSHIHGITAKVHQSINQFY